MIDGDQIAGAIEGLGASLTDVVITVLDRRRDRRWLNEVAARLDEMLRNPKGLSRLGAGVGREVGLLECDEAA